MQSALTFPNVVQSEKLAIFSSHTGHPLPVFRALNMGASQHGTPTLCPIPRPPFPGPQGSRLIVVIEVTCLPRAGRWLLCQAHAKEQNSTTNGDSMRNVFTLLPL